LGVGRAKRQTAPPPGLQPVARQKAEPIGAYDAGHQPRLWWLFCCLHGGYDTQGLEDAEALEIATRAARAGGQVALVHLGQPDYQRWKGPRDLVTGGGWAEASAV